MTEPADKPGLYQWTPALLFGGLGQHTYSELQRALNAHGSSFSFSAQSDAFSFSGTWRSDDLDLSLRCVTAFFTDPAYRPEGEQKTKMAIGAAYGALRGTSAEPLTLRVVPFLCGGAPDIASPPYSKSSRHSVADLKRWLKPILQNGCVEIALVGDFDVEQTIDEVARTFGTLPARSVKPDIAKQNVLKLPLPPKEQRFDFAAANRPATLVYFWPVREQLSTTNKIQLQLLSGILRDRLLVRIRENMGETYAPRANFASDLAHPGYAHLSCTLDVNLNKTEAVAQAVRELTAGLADTGITEDELARVKAQLLTSLRDARQTNNYWLSRVLQAAQEHPERLDEARTAMAAIERTTKTDLDALATRYLKAENLFQFTLQPKPPTK
jgi:zinc protease